MSNQKELKEKIERTDKEIEYLNKKRDRLEKEIIDAYKAVKTYTEKLEKLEASMLKIEVYRLDKVERTYKKIVILRQTAKTYWIRERKLGGYYETVKVAKTTLDYSTFQFEHEAKDFLKNMIKK
tara:strand:+ start:499 stop:870 length:372 start_codon:yes stop_codon:yes gene_type:complete